jgi:hypothetical protein
LERDAAVGYEFGVIKIAPEDPLQFALNGLDERRKLRFGIPGRDREEDGNYGLERSLSRQRLFVLKKHRQLGGAGGWDQE